MTATGGRPLARAPQASIESVLVWIDARRATMVRLDEPYAVIEHVISDVPAHRRSTGNVRHDPSTRHGGGGQRTGEANRLEHLARFVDLVAARLPSGNINVIGPGTVREHLERAIREADERHGRIRALTCEPADKMTERQLVARLRDLVGAPLERRQTGA